METELTTRPAESSLPGLEFVRCNLCGSDQGRRMFSVSVLPHQRGKFARDSWDVLRCTQCGFVYKSPRPDKAALASFYSFQEPGDLAFVEGWFIENADLQRPTWQRYLHAIQRACPSGRLLDVGCGAGSFLIEARQAGFDVAGQDISPYFAELCRKQGLAMYEMELGELARQPQAFDCVTAFDVIEHHPDPAQMIRDIYQLLKPGGVVAISTHDVGNFFARLYGPRWRHIGGVSHLHFFSRGTLRALLSRQGFQVVHISGIHTIDRNRLAESRNAVSAFFKVIIFRALVLGVYKPLASLLPFLSRWQFRWGQGVVNHQKLLARAGTQIIMNDDLVCLARKR